MFRYRIFKRWMDFAVGSVFLLLSAPVQAVVALLVFVLLGRPVFFIQERPGLNGEVFRLIKFRTMRNAGTSHNDSSDASRMTRFGSFLRSTSLDELPTLLNVVRGDMSLVGPRPLLVSYLNIYSAEEARRHEVRPGITGLAQVSGRNMLTWEERFRLDVLYVEQTSLRLDLAILWRTFLTVLRRQGISAPGHATMEEFRREPNQ